MSARSNADLAIIGAGSAGMAAAIAAAREGASVTLLGHGLLGGTCVNVGCVPSKTMIRAAEALHGARAASRFPGLSGRAHVNDWALLQQARADMVADLRQAKYADVLADWPDIRLLDAGPARLIPGGVEAGDHRVLAKSTIVATGGRPAIPTIPGLETVRWVDSTALLEIPALPERLAVVGGGYIAVELAQMMARMGSHVTIFARSGLLPGVEPEVQTALVAVLQQEGVTVHERFTDLSVTQKDGGVQLSAIRREKKVFAQADVLLLATGRAANVESLGLAAAGVVQNAAGHICVDSMMATSAAGIWAAGDVTDRHAFVYMAAHGGSVAARNALGAKPALYDDSAVPWVVFSDPQIAGVGLTEAEARLHGLAIETSILPLDLLPRAIAARDTRGLVKLVAEAGTHRLLGGTIMGPEAGDSVQTLALAIRMGLSADVLAGHIFPYLTMVEGLKLAAQGFSRDVRRLSCCAA